MKEVYKYIMATAALLFAAFTFGPAASAQDDGSKVYFDKGVSGPDENGVYTISIEAYVTGNLTVTTETAPADIILVLDYSTSMDRDIAGNSRNVSNEDKRINLLRDAVKEFVDVVKTSNASLLENNGVDTYGGHRIAFVLFGGSVITTPSNLNTFLNAENLSTTASSGSGDRYSPATISYSDQSLLSPSTNRGTSSDLAMDRAKTILSNVDYSVAPDRSRVVVFFTDGAPGEGSEESGWENNNERLTVANNCIDKANDIKTSQTYGATVYSVGLFNKAAGTIDATTTYLSYTSSDIKDKTEMPSSNNYVSVSNEKSIIVNNSSALSQVFTTIATSEGGNYSASSSSSVLVDIVATSFYIPDPEDNLGKVKVYKDTCTTSSASQLLPTFANNYVDITSSVTLGTNYETGEVTVTGFDYGANWCGWDESANNNNGGSHGNRLILEIPIEIKATAVGGPSVETNTGDSKLIIKDKEGNPISEYSLPKPTLPIPVSIWIQKQGLVGDDSAVFTLRRAPFAENFDPDKATWETFTKIVVNEKNMVEVTDDAGNTVKVVKISGLDPNYYYKIEEDAWGFGYTYQNKGIHYTVGDNLKNPFVFVNTPKDVKKAEAVVRNVFEERTTEITQ